MRSRGAIPCYCYPEAINGDRLAGGVDVPVSEITKMNLALTEQMKDFSASLQKAMAEHMQGALELPWQSRCSSRWITCKAR